MPRPGLAGACRVPAADIETIVEDRICNLLLDEAAVFEMTGPATVESRKAMIENAADLARRWSTLSASDRRAMLHALVKRIDVCLKTVDITIRPAALPGIAGSGPIVDKWLATDGLTRVLSVPARLKRTGMETKLLVQGTSGPADRKLDRSLIRLLGQAHRFRSMLMTEGGKSMRKIAGEAGVSSSWFTRMFRLSFLAPEITKMILQGRQPPGLTANRIMQTGRLASSWNEQKAQLDIA